MAGERRTLKTLPIENKSNPATRVTGLPTGAPGRTSLRADIPLRTRVNQAFKPNTHLDFVERVSFSTQPWLAGWQKLFKYSMLTLNSHLFLPLHTIVPGCSPHILPSPQSQCPRLLLYQTSSHLTQTGNHPTTNFPKKKGSWRGFQHKRKGDMEGQWRVTTTKTMHNPVEGYS